MQTVSGTLTTAITSKEREPLARVRVDWDHDGNFTSTYDDLSTAVESVTVDRSITTDLPDAARTVTGYAAAEVTVVLAGTLSAASMPVAQLLSAYNASSPLASEVRITSPIDVDLGFRTSAGEEWANALVGKVRSVNASAGGRTVGVAGLDSREAVRTRVTLPVFVANDKGTGAGDAKKPGLDGQWVIDHVMRRNGFYASPPPRASVLMSATMHGSAWPETGTLTSANYDVAEIQPAAFVAGNFAEALSFPASGQSHVAYEWPTGPSATDRLVEGWFYLTNTAADQGLWHLLDRISVGGFSLYATYAAGVYTLKISAVQDYTTDLFDTKTLGTITAGAWHYIGVQIKRTAVGSPDTYTVTCRLDGTTLGTQTLGCYAPMFGTSGTSFFTVGYGRVSSASSSLGPTAFVGSVEAVQVTGETSTTTWNNAYAPTAVLEPSLNPLTAVPVVVKADPWDLIVDVAEAEGGIVLFDEAGVFRFYNRNHLSGGSAVATISSLTNLVDAASEESVDGVRNLVRVLASPLKIGSAADVRIWALSEVVSVPASGSTVIEAKCEGGVYELDTSASYYNSTSLSKSTIYRAAKKQDGTGGDVSNLTFAFAAEGDTVRITVTNPNAFIVWLVNNSLSFVAEQQTVTLSGSPTGGTFNLSFNGKTTRNIAHNASAATVEAALVALSNIVTGDVSVSGSAGGPWTVTFTGNLLGDKIREMGGSGANLTGGSSPSLDVATVTEGGKDDAGQPALALGGRLVVPAAGADEQGQYLTEASDATSITTYGSQPIDLDENPWMQSKVSAEALGTALLAKLKDPHPVLTGVQIVADPRLQLADRVTVVEPDGLVVNHDFWVIGITTTLDGSGMSQSLALRQA